MEHKETGGVAPVDEAAFRAVWSKNGWTKVTTASRKTREALAQAEAQAVADGEAEAFKEAEAAVKKKLAKVKADAKARTQKQAKGGSK
jgi:coenzyme F420-reducing hydrogenase beta subunit